MLRWRNAANSRGAPREAVTVQPRRGLPFVDFDRRQKPALIQIQRVLSEKLFGAKLPRNHLLIYSELHDRLDSFPIGPFSITNPEGKRVSDDPLE